jgi:ABC-type tungstate transport system substrate-binding protein
MIFDAEVFQITILSLQISALATGLSLFIGLPFGTLLALGRFPGAHFCSAWSIPAWDCRQWWSACSWP